jgi:hypothetical protein
MAHWFTENKDLLTAAVAVLGVGLALYAALTNRGQRRRDALYRIHDLLTSTDQQRGRRLLFGAARTGQFPDLDSDEYATMNRAIATLDAVGLYMRRRIVPRRWVLDIWHHPFTDIRPAAYAFIAYRRSTYNTGWRGGQGLEDLLDQASRYRTRRACCTEFEPDPGTGRSAPPPAPEPSQPAPV